MMYNTNMYILIYRSCLSEIVKFPTVKHHSIYIFKTHQKTQ